MARTSRIVAALALAFVSLSVVLAGPFEDGKAAYDKGDYTMAMRLWRPLAEQGTAEAQFNLGLMYNNGQGVPQDYVEAHKWYNLAASRFAPGEDGDKAVRNRNLVAEEMTREQVAEAQKRAREWKPAQ